MIIKKTNAPDAWMKVLTTAKRDYYGGIAAMTHEQNGQAYSKGESVQYQKRFSIITVWTSCIRPGSLEIFRFLYFFKYLPQKRLALALLTIPFTTVSVLTMLVIC